MQPLILGTKSKRRIEILSYFTLPFDVIPSLFDEDTVSYHNDPSSYVEEIAKGKALSLAERFPDRRIITADTIVVHQGQLFEKPQTEEEAFQMLSTLSGSRNEVWSGVCVHYKDQILSNSTCTQVEFHPLSESQIKRYIETMNPMERSGAYTLQQAGGLIAKEIKGCFYNVMGLPLTALSSLLNETGVDLWDSIPTSSSP